VPSGGRRAAVPGRGSLGARITCSRRQGRLTARPSRCHGYHQEVGVLQLDDKDGSRPVHLAAVGTIRRSVCCSSMTRTAHGPVISLPWVPSGGQCAAAPGRGSLGARITCSRRQGRLTARPSRCRGYHQEVGVLQLDDKDGSRPRHLAAASTSGGQCAAVPGRGSLALAKL
jgi:hypothetical protein